MAVPVRKTGARCIAISFGVLKPCRGLVAVALALAAAVAVSGNANANSQNAAFKDPLKVPAMESSIAGSSPLMGVSRAGQRLVAVGERGDIVYSDDQGKHWTQASVPVSTDLTAVYFPTAQQGWAVGHEGVILHSSDGGGSWSVQMNGWQAAKLLVHYYKEKSKADQDKYKRVLRNAQSMARFAPALAFLDVWFKNTQVGFVVGQFNIILKTTDGGKTWVPWNDRAENPRNYHLYSIRGANSHLYIAGERGLFLRLDRQSDTFVSVHTPYQGSYFGVAAKGKLVVTFGLGGHAYVSRNKGKSWHKADLATNNTLTGGVIDHGRIVLVTNAGSIFVSGQPGWKFTKVSMSHPRPIYDIASINPNNVALVGASGLWSETLSASNGK